MTIKIFGDRAPGPIDGIKKSPKNRSPRESNNSGSTSDRVDFSAMFKEVSRARDVLPLASVERAEKVQALKDQVAQGCYHPDLHKVAASLLRFLVQGRQV